MAKSLPANAGDIRDGGSVPGSGRSSGEGHGNPLKAWLITAAIRSSNSLLGRADRRHGVGAEALEGLFTEDDTDHAVYDAVMELPEKYRTAVHLFYYEGYSVEEIGRMTDTNPSTVKSHLHRAREALRRALKEDEPDV